MDGTKRYLALSGMILSVAMPLLAQPELGPDGILLTDISMRATQRSKETQYITSTSALLMADEGLVYITNVNMTARQGDEGNLETQASEGYVKIVDTDITVFELELEEEEVVEEVPEPELQEIATTAQDSTTTEAGQLEIATSGEDSTTTGTVEEVNPYLNFTPTYEQIAKLASNFRKNAAKGDLLLFGKNPRPTASIVDAANLESEQIIWSEMMKKVLVPTPFTQLGSMEDGTKVTITGAALVANQDFDKWTYYATKETSGRMIFDSSAVESSQEKGTDSE